ncbi:MAG: anthranilate synthase component I family protein [Planctomycetota bacterium]
MQQSRTILHSGGPVTRWSRYTYILGDPVDEIQGTLADLPSLGNEPADEDAPPFTGGWVGHISYDAGRALEPDKLTAAPPDDLGIPHIHFTRHTDLLVHDRLQDRWTTIGAPRLEPGLFTSVNRAEPRQTFARARFESSVQRVIDYIAAGDIFQANLSQRFSIPWREPPHVLFERLIERNPAWYGALLDRGDYALVSNSPELYLQLDPTGRVVTRPIKGTRPAGTDPDELLASAKDAAELNMIVDLERNDLGRVCELGSVRVSEPRHIEDHGNVLHGVATIEGKLRDDATLADVIAATFPGGSITGAPKVRAMQILDELEPVQRGPYCGAIGFISDTGHATFNIAIRTIVLAGYGEEAWAHVNVGGGIVADSDPADEYEETLVKARAMFDALGFEI